LLGASSSGGASGCGKTIWILSVGFLGGMALVSVLIALAVVKIGILSKMVYGYQARAKSLRELEKYLEKRKTTTGSATEPAVRQSVGEP